MKPFGNILKIQSAGKLCIAVLLLFTYIVLPKNAFAQSCATTTPAYTLDFTGKPDTTWTSPSVSRDGLCCGKTGSDRCILFYITLDSMSSGIVVDAVGGLGATDYEIKCANPTPLGNRTCIANAGSFYVTICKPGGNPQQYTVSSVPKPYIVKNPVSISPNCPATLQTAGLVTSSITWKSLSGSTYNNNLSCTSGCSTSVVTASANFPTYVDYLVCGTPVNTTCFGSTYCDTVRVYYYDTLKVKLNPRRTAYLCTGTTSTRVTATASGGKAPYTYSWTGGSTDSSRLVGAGTHVVTVKDALGCQVARDTVVVTAGTSPTPSIVGSSIICQYEEGTYFTAPQLNRSYTWEVNGGVITSGDGTNLINVTWSNTGLKTIKLTETNTVTGCSGITTRTVTVHKKPTIDSINH